MMISAAAAEATANSGGSKARAMKGYKPKVSSSVQISQSLVREDEPTAAGNNNNNNLLRMSHMNLELDENEVPPMS